MLINNKFYLNHNQYIRREEIDVHQLFALEDLSDIAAGKQAEILLKLKGLLR